MENWMVMAKKADFFEIGKRFSIDPVVARVIRNRDIIAIVYMALLNLFFQI